jgi:penicillin-binding protein 2
MSPNLVAPALRDAANSAEAVAPATLDAQVLQALSHVQPPPDLPGPRGRSNPVVPASAPAASPKDRKPATKPNPTPKPAPKPASAP